VVPCSQSVLAFSNRAMTYLKVKEFLRAEADATAALAIDAQHVKVSGSSVVSYR
jgi:hypothetical protein